jgi:hypothetical protein
LQWIIACSEAVSSDEAVIYHVPSKLVYRSREEPVANAP